MHALALLDPQPAYTPGQLAAFLGIAAFLLGLVLLSRRVFGHEPPLHKEYITRSEVEKIERSLKDDLTEQASARQGMHEQITVIAGEMQALKATNEAQSTTLQELTADTKLNSSKVDQMIGETKQLNTQLQQLVLTLKK